MENNFILIFSVVDSKTNQILENNKIFKKMLTKLSVCDIIITGGWNVLLLNTHIREVKAHLRAIIFFYTENVRIKSCHFLFFIIKTNLLK